MVSIQQYAGSYSGHSLSEFNNAAAQLQRDAGVNPMDCMQIVECNVVNILGITPVEIFVDYLSKNKFPTAPREISEHRSHDESNHFGIVVSTHPEIAKFYVELASMALDGHLKGGIDWVADTLDGALGTGAYYVFSKMHGNSPKPDETVRHGDLVYEPANRQNIVDIDRNHQSNFFKAANNWFDIYNRD